MSWENKESLDDWLSMEHKKIDVGEAFLKAC